MQELKRTLAFEQTPINETLFRFAAELPAGARPVAEHILAAGGKRLRPLLTILCGRALGCRDDSLYTLGAAIELLHAATLLHDDILDNADTRRGQPAAHTQHPPSVVLLAGDAMLAKAMLMVSSFHDPRLTACISEAVMRTAAGQIAEFAHLRDASLAHADYLDIITGKTAWMLRASCELGALRSGADGDRVTAAAVFGLELGIAFQIVDDALDFAPGTGKPVGGDLREGKLTPPLLFYVDSLEPAQAAAFKQAFANGSLTPEETEAAAKAVYSEGHGRTARTMADRHLRAAGEALDSLPGSPEREALRQMLDYVRNRDH